MKLEDLFKRKESDLILEGNTFVKVRGLTRGIMDDIEDASKDDYRAMVRWVIKEGVISPPLSEQDVKNFPSGWVDKIFSEIMILSGYGKEEDVEKK